MPEHALGLQHQSGIDHIHRRHAQVFLAQPPQRHQGHAQFGGVFRQWPVRAVVHVYQLAKSRQLLAAS
ncbi:hypothetical protein D3C76_413300 [compost metagenome]